MVVVSMVCQSGNGIAPNVGEISKENSEGIFEILEILKKHLETV